CLAFARRCTSAVPFESETMMLRDVEELLANPRFRQRYGNLGSRFRGWHRFFGDYPAERYPTQAFGDGGYLDNKPFSWATGMLSRRRADGPVQRRLLYIEPDPGRVPAKRKLPGVTVAADELTVEDPLAVAPPDP